MLITLHQHLSPCVVAALISLLLSGFAVPCVHKEFTISYHNRKRKFGVRSPSQVCTRLELCPVVQQVFWMNISKCNEHFFTKPSDGNNLECCSYLSCIWAPEHQALECLYHWKYLLLSLPPCHFTPVSFPKYIFAHLKKQRNLKFMNYHFLPYNLSIIKYVENLNSEGLRSSLTTFSILSILNNNSSAMVTHMLCPDFHFARNCCIADHLSGCSTKVTLPEESMCDLG